MSAVAQRAKAEAKPINFLRGDMVGSLRYPSSLRLRKFLKIALLVCLALAAIPAAMYITLWLWIWYETAKADEFYRDHRLLGEMRAAEKESTNNSVPAREAFLKIVPLGTDREAAIAVLRKETLNCQGIVGPVLTCQTMSPNGFGSKQWIVYLDFDADGRLSDARIAIWNIFL
ncbi:hypothetical protein [Bradyrhizobium sp. AZCC 1721]|uniref:hypothetical protein n=1 Tax=Bradyrhizobium sp. AZCC 1721 TaxID=3117016 RepID=UPI002FF0BC91